MGGRVLPWVCRRGGYRGRQGLRQVGMAGRPKNSMGLARPLGAFQELTAILYMGCRVGAPCTECDDRILSWPQVFYIGYVQCTECDDPVLSWPQGGGEAPNTMLTRLSHRLH